MDTTLYSLIIPSFNPGAKLAPTIESALNQQPGLSETIVVDGGSTDGTSAVLQQYAGRIRSVSEPDRGIYDAMNKGIALAKGQFINFQGAGDVLRPNILAKIAPRMPARGAAIVYGKVLLADIGEINGEEFSKSTFRNGNVPHQAMFYSREVFDTMGKYELQYPLLADYAFNIKCFGDERVRKLFVDEVIADYEGGGATTQRFDKKFHADLPGLIRKHLGMDVYLLWRAQRLIPMQWRRARSRRKNPSQTKR